MTSYVVLARKWRPAQFSDIVGQTHIVRTLTNAIRLERIHHAYLFTGSRGIGKTSIARIFAKALRCQNTKEVNGFIESCDQCSSCKEITQGNSVDVIEIDGASNNGVEAVREIRDNARYTPSSGSRKIYIIDEVHMLTTAAFNALLKTLEEPPSHVIFIFATTEPHKIPATILSRCQKFDYRRVTLPQIQGRLSQITTAEGISCEAGVGALIAKAAEGSMRDALSLLDQVIAFAGNSVSLQSVRESVGLIEGQTLFKILEGIFERKPLAALASAEQAYQQGHDLRVLTRHLIETLHSTILAKIGAPQPTALEASPGLFEEDWKEIQTLSQLRSLEEMELIFQVLHQGLEWIARSPQPKTVLDILLIKCATADALIPLTPTSPSEAPPLSKASLTPPPSGVVAAAPASEKTWSGFIDYVRNTRPLLASILEHASGAKLPALHADPTDRNSAIYFSPSEAYFKEQLQSKSYQEQLSHFAKEYFESSDRFQIEFREAGESLAAKRQREQKERFNSAKERAENHPILLEAKSLFGGKMGPIDVREVNHVNTST